MTGTRVVAAAIMVGNCIWTLPRPARHSDVMHLMHIHGVSPQLGERGFLIATDDPTEGPFVTRWRACQIARANGQVTLEHTRDLFSEDVW